VDVAALQAKLGLTPDGVLGSQTLAALKAFQQAHGLRPDGVVGPQTRSALGI
jgi:peptidoglycan hydrolase-like protein with peptidoglycan-binding domain